jgi:hypothetical protein
MPLIVKLRQSKLVWGFSSIPRSELFSALFLLGCANGLAGRVWQSIVQHDGWLVAVLATFKISVIIFVACFAGVSLVFRDGLEDGSYQTAIKCGQNWSGLLRKLATAHY